MFNIINMENYRLRKSKSTYVILLFLLVTIILSLFLVYSINQNILKENNEYENIEISIEGEYYEMDGDSFLLSQYENTTLLFFVIIFGGIFFTSPYSNSFIKNFIGVENKKYKYIISVYIVGALFTLFLFIISALITTLGLPIVSNGNLIIKNIGNIIKVLSVQYLLHIAYLSLILLISTITRSTSISLLISLSYGLILINLFIFLIDKILEKIFVLKENFSIGNYSIVKLIENLNSNNMNRAILISIILITIWIFLSSIVIKKKDFEIKERKYYVKYIKYGKL